MNKFPPDMDSTIYTLLACALAFALIDDFTALEQNAIGNWFMTVGQVLENNAAFEQLREQRRQNIKNTAKERKNKEEHDMIFRMIKILEQEYNNIIKK